MIEYIHSFDSGTGVCTVFVKGTFRRPESTRKMQRLMRDLHSEHQCHHFLFDLTNAVVVSGTFDTFEAGSTAPGMEHTIRQFRIAIVYSKLTEDEQFFENVAVNRGYQLRVFDNRDKALEWLGPIADNTYRDRDAHC